MKVSVIIPSYKPGDYIWECLDSLCNQTLSPDNYEIIVILNGCKEPWYDNLVSYKNEHEKWNIVIIQTDLGNVSNARNLGIDAAQGEYIAFIDDDDWVTPTYKERLVDVSENNAVVQANEILLEGDKQRDYFMTRAYNKNVGKEKISLFSGRSFLSSVVGKIVPRNVIADDRFSLQHRLGQDSLFMFRISKRINKLKTAANDAVYYVRYRTDSASHRHHSYGYRVKIAVNLTLSYVRIYLSDVFHYNFVFFLTRVAATLRKLGQRKYERD